MAERLPRRQFLRVVGAAAAATAASGCSPLIEEWATVTPLPTHTPVPTETPYPDLISGTNENIPTTIPHVSIMTRNVAFEDAASLVDKARSRNIAAIPRGWDRDWFADISNYKENELYTYFDSRNQRLYSGFGLQGRDDEILGWEEVAINKGERAIYSDVSGKFGYFLFRVQENRTANPGDRQAFVFVDIPNSRKIFIKYERIVESGGFNIGFEISNQANVLAINLLQSQAHPEKGVYLLDTENWGLTSFIHEHVNDMRISEDGSLIYSSRGPRFSSKIINASTGEVELIDWASQGVGYNPSRDIDREVLSLNLQYISTQVYSFYQAPPGYRSYSTFLYNLVKTSTGFVKIDEGEARVWKITNEGIVHLSGGRTIDLGE